MGSRTLHRRVDRLRRLSAAEIAAKIRAMSDAECRRVLAGLLGISADELPGAELAPPPVVIDLDVLTADELRRLAAGEPLADVRPDWRTLVKQRP